MSHYCAVTSCKNSNKNTYMHKFTRREPTFQQWLKAVGRPELYTRGKEAICNSMYVCDIHFAPSCKFTRTGKTNLKVGSVPTLFLTVPPDANTDPLPASSLENVGTNNAKDSFPVNTVPLSIDYQPNGDINVSLSIDYQPNDGDINIVSSYVDFPEADEVIFCESLGHSPEAMIEENSFDGRCRICLTESENIIPLSHSTNINGEESRTLCEILNKCSKLQVAIEDNKPQSLCIDCVEMVKVVYEFNIRCEKSESILQKELECISEQDSQQIHETCSSSGKEYSEPIKTITELPANEKCEELTNSRLKNVTHYRKRVRMKNVKRKSTVNEEKNIMCVHCGTNFNKLVRFKCYRNVLIGKKRLKCTKCGVRFANIGNLKLHRKTFCGGKKKTIVM